MLGRHRQAKGRHLSGTGLLLIVLALMVTACVGAASSPTVVVVHTLKAHDPVAAEFESELSAALEDYVEFLRIGPETEDLAAAIGLLVASEPDLIVTFTTPASVTVGEALQATDIPQVFGIVTDPIDAGLVDSIDAPGLNRTGVGNFHIDRAVDLVFEATGANSIGVFHQPSDAASVTGLTLARRAASMLGIEVVEMIVENDSDLEGVLAGGPVEGVDAVLIVGSPFTVRNIGAFSDAVATWDVPAALAMHVNDLPEGFLLGVLPDQSDIARQMADRSVAILNGGAAGRIPIGAAANLALIDLEQARRLGIQIPDHVLVEFGTILGGI